MQCYRARRSFLLFSYDYVHHKDSNMGKAAVMVAAFVSLTILGASLLQDILLTAFECVIFRRMWPFILTKNSD